MSEPMTFLQRIALAAASERFPAAGVPAGGLTLGRLVRRRRVRLARGLPALEVEPAEAQEPDMTALQSPSPGFAPRPADGTPLSERVLGEKAQAPGRSPQARSFAAAPRVPERFDPMPSAGRVEGLDRDEAVLPRFSVAPAEDSQAPAHRPAAVLSSSPAAALPVLRQRLQRDEAEPGAAAEEEEKEPPAVARALSDEAASASPGEEIEKEEDEQPSVARAFLAAAAPAAARPAAPRPVPVAPLALPGPLAPRSDRGVLAPQVEPLLPRAHFAEDTAAPSERSAGEQTESALPGGHPRAPAQRRGEPPSLPQAPEIRVAPEPVVHIGSIEIVIEAPAPEPRSAAATKQPAADLASRLYLRGL
jgi:hypothetical protein